MNLADSQSRIHNPKMRKGYRSRIPSPLLTISDEDSFERRVEMSRKYCGTDAEFSAMVDMCELAGRHNHKKKLLYYFERIQKDSSMHLNPTDAEDIQCEVANAGNLSLLQKLHNLMLRVYEKTYREFGEMGDLSALKWLSRGHMFWEYTYLAKSMSWLSEATFYGHLDVLEWASGRIEKHRLQDIIAGGDISSVIWLLNSSHYYSSSRYDGNGMNELIQNDIKQSAMDRANIPVIAWLRGESDLYDRSIIRNIIRFRGNYDGSLSRCERFASNIREYKLKLEPGICCIRSCVGLAFAHHIREHHMTEIKLAISETYGIPVECENHSVGM